MTVPTVLNGASTLSAPLDASKLKTTFTSTPKKVSEISEADIVAQRACTDHMITASWSAEKGWDSPQLVPHGPIPLMPTASVLHYATECFEGMKLYRGYDGKLRLFRPENNCRRMAASAERISLPPCEPRELHQLIRKLCATDGSKWLPKERPGASLYIRPTLIGTDSSLGFHIPDTALLFVILVYGSSARPDLSSGDAAMGAVSQTGLRLLASPEDAVRAWPGGTGYAKIGANYGPALAAHGKAKKDGYDQVLWLLGKERCVTEAGASNLFVIWRTKEGALELATPPLDDRTILPGVTRQSVLELARDRLNGSGKTPLGRDVEPVNVVERSFTMTDLINAADELRLLATFVVGTACFVQSVAEITYNGRRLQIDVEQVPHVSLLRNWLADITFGKETNEWADIVDDE